MTRLAHRPFTRAAGPVAAALACFAGCATMDGPTPSQPAAAATTAAAPAAPQGRPTANFSAELRCMDSLLLTYGARDYTLSVDDLADAARKPQPGTKELLISAISDMTRRSRAVRVAALGPDVTPAPGLHAMKPQYALRGSVGKGDAATPGLRVDLTLLTAQDMTVVPGVSAREQALLSSRGDATFQKFGIDFSVPAAAVPGPSPALGALMQLSAIELVGRLAKVPYWSCLGATEDEPGVTAEVRDWYDTMATRPAEIIEYFQAQMRLRRLYDGPIDGTVNPQIKDAVARYREALGQSREAKLSLDFFKAYLAANHKEIAAKIQPASPTPPPTPAPTSTPAPASAPATAVATAAAPVKTAAPAQAVPSAKLALSVATPGNNNHFSRGEKIELSIKPSRDAHVYCFMQDENRKVVRFFPNRFQRDSHVVAATGLSLPGKMRFEMRMNPSGRQETISCFATERDVLADLPSGLGAADFDPLPVADIQQVRDAFVTVTAGAFAQEVLHVQPR